MIKESCDDKSKDNKIYRAWYDVHYRCYSEVLHMRYPSYIGCEVCEEWHDYNKFAEWYKANYYEVVINGKKSKIDLDKDILNKGNKIYCPEFCVFVPHEINTLVINCKKRRGEYPIGVSYTQKDKRFRAEILRRKLGSFKTAKQAFAAYKKEKEKQIKKVARKYRNQIPDKLYKVLVHWKIEITD